MVETAGLNKEEADFVSKYLALADELLKPSSAENPPAQQTVTEQPTATGAKAA